ncbi:hypothetical protein [Microcoleus sp. B3-D7]|uniref:hypothetical protein n=1 Tax=Microcoleus sp. B3-D7 TaxID=2818659 RepID=UPI002FD12B67
MNFALDKNEATRRMQARQKKSVVWTLKDMTVEWQIIPATQARNWDGSPAGQGNDPHQEILSRMVLKKGCHPRFTNWW